MRISIKNLSVKLGGHDVLKNLSAEVPNGSFSVLLGQNGAGKTTLVSTLSGLFAYRGDILLGDKPLATLAAKDRARLISIVPQLPARASITVEDLLAFGRLPYHTLGERLNEGDHDRMEQAMELFDLNGLRSATLDRISGGELRRAYLAMAFVQDTPVIVLDEPTAHLDAQNQARILEILKMLNEKHGKTVLAVMHRIADAVQYADRLLLMRDGCVIRQGSVDELLAGRCIEEAFGVERYTGEIWGVRR